jgi:threonine dehydratase
MSWRQRTVVETDCIETIADGVAGRCPIPEVLDDLLVVLSDVMLVREDSIKAGMRMIYETILCGSNVSPTDFARWVLEPVSR